MAALAGSPAGLKRRQRSMPARVSAAASGPASPQINTVQANAVKRLNPCSPVQSIGESYGVEIVAKRDSETVTMQRNSSLIAIAKARVWASEGWDSPSWSGMNRPRLQLRNTPSLGVASAPFGGGLVIWLFDAARGRGKRRSQDAARKSSKIMD